MLGFKGPPIGNGLLGIKWSRDRWHHVTPKSQTRDPNTLRAQYLLEILFSNNRYIVCCEAVRSAILATVWLLVCWPCGNLTCRLWNTTLSYFWRVATDGSATAAKGRKDW